VTAAGDYPGVLPSLKQSSTRAPSGSVRKIATESEHNARIIKAANIRAE
jgi:hypothetical protein